MSSTTTKGIVINYQEYDDYDAIVKIITNKRIISFLARGVRKVHSKNRSSLLLLNEAEFEIFLARLNNRMSKLKKATLISFFDLQNNSFSYTELQEILFYLDKLEYSNSYLYELIKQSIKIANKENVFFIKTYLLCHLLEYFGYKQSFDKCVTCKSNKELRDFQFFEGGFSCKYHFKTSFQRTIEELKTFYYLSHSLEVYIKFANYKANFSIYKEIKQFIKENII
ncbi:DNA repair protein RecO [Mycoplasma sp. Z386]